MDDTRSFTDTLTHATLSGNSFKLEYTYNLSGGLKSTTDPYGDEIEYTLDKSGRLNQVTGSTYGGIITAADEAKYRAWGGLKSLEYGNGVERVTTFNNRLLPSGFELKKDSTDLMVKDYEYYKDGSLKFVDDQLNAVFDRLQTYDHAGRAKDGTSGAEASGGIVATEDQDTQLPYRQSYSFNAFGNMTQRNNLHWGKDFWQSQSNNLSYTYVNNRISGYQYDADGRTTISSEGSQTFISNYHARGLLIRYNTTYSIANTWDQNIVNRFYNGDGREVKRQKTTFAEDINMTDPPYGTWSFDQPTYYIRSSVLGGETVTEVGPTGKKIKTTVFAAGAKIATQSQYTWSTTDHKSVAFHHVDESGMSHRSTSNTGIELGGDGQFDGGPAETDPMGGNMGLNTPYIELLPPPEPPTGDWGFIPLESDAPMFVNGQQVTCSLDGMAIGCAQAFRGLGTSSDIDFANSDRWALRALGIFAYEMYGTRTINNAPGTAPSDTGTGGDDTPIVVNSNTTTEQYFIGWGYNVSWVPQARQNPVLRAEKLPLGDKISTRSLIPLPPAMNDCEKFLANLFTGTDDAIFSDITDEDPRDVLSGALEGPRRDPDGVFNTHNHLYNPPSDVSRKTAIFAPPGGIVRNSGLRMSKGGRSQRWTNVFYPERNITLQFWHVDGAARTRTPSKQRISLGTMSADGIWSTYMVNGKRLVGLHMHLNAYRGDWSGLLNDDQKEKNYLKLSSLCP